MTGALADMTVYRPSRQSKEDVHTGDHLDTVEKMEFLGNGCPYPGMWCDTVVTLSMYDAPVEIV